jgi:hypothetical protein
LKIKFRLKFQKAGKRAGKVGKKIYTELRRDSLMILLKILLRAYSNQDPAMGSTKKILLDWINANISWISRMRYGDLNLFVKQFLSRSWINNAHALIESNTSSIKSR